MNYNYIQTFRWIYSRLLPHRKKQFWFLFAGMSFAALLETIALGTVAFFASVVTDPEVVLNSRYVTFAKQFSDADFLSSVKDLILVSGVIMLVLITFKNSVKAIVTYWMARFGVGLEAYFGSKLLNGFLTLPYKWHLTCNTADLVNAVNWRTFLGRSFFQPCLNIFNSFLMVSIMLTALFIVQPLVSFIVIVVIGCTAAFIYSVIRQQIDKVASDARDYQIAINKEITMAIHGIKDVKISRKENLFVSKFMAKAEPLSRIFGVQSFYTQCPVLILETIGFVMICLSVFAMLLWFNTSTAYVTATMAILAVTAWKALPAVNQILASVTRLRKSLPYISSQIEYFNLIEANIGPSQKKSTHSPKSDIDEQSNVRTQTTESFEFIKTIKFNNVSFGYEDNGRKVLHDLSFEIKKGETIGIIGTSGAGKSTLVDLLIGLLEPAKGTIYIDNKVLTQDFLAQWLTITGYVSQSPYIYDGTLAENVAFGIDQADIDREQVRKCCTMASMDDFIHDLTDNIDSFIGERGIKLSGGQQQRVAIARALYNKPEVMIFDEATSSLDTKSEKAIQKTIYSFKGRQTLIIIAHRLTTIEDCDKVIWLEKGTVKMIGKPKEVLGVYNQDGIRFKNPKISKPMNFNTSESI
jgi:ATP-binding cassette, subfamily B, bacterial PglK